MNFGGCERAGKRRVAEESECEQESESRLAAGRQTDSAQAANSDECLYLRNKLRGAQRMDGSARLCRTGDKPRRETVLCANAKLPVRE